jgi:hypothetical protein
MTGGSAAIRADEGFRPKRRIQGSACGGRGIEPLPCGASASSISKRPNILLTWGAAPNQAPRNREQHLCPKLRFALSFDAIVHIHLHFHFGFRHHEAGQSSTPRHKIDRVSKNKHYSRTQDTSVGAIIKRNQVWRWVRTLDLCPSPLAISHHGWIRLPLVISLLPHGQRPFISRRSWRSFPTAVLDGSTFSNPSYRRALLPQSSDEMITVPVRPQAAHVA